MDFEEAAEEVESRRNDRKEPTLQKTENALEELGRPDRDYEVILIGGTNGKGSTAEMTSQMLQSLGFKVGKFTSPHLITLRERIEIDGEKISREDFMALYRQLDGFDLTFFEFMTVAAYQYFSQNDVDYAVIEVGMGGRLDATNAADNSTAAITNVGRDHMKYLGDTREEIAEEKAGIIPENGLLIDNSDMEIFRERAEKQNTERFETLDINQEDGKLEFQEQSFELPVKGDFQKENLETALTVVKEVEKIPENISDALDKVQFPGRMETVSEEPETILDGAHNPDALEKTIKEYEDGFICVLGATRTKEIQEMIDIVERKASKIYVTAPDYRLAEKPEVVSEKISIEKQVFRDPLKALTEAQKEDSQVVVTGSLYLVGDLKKKLDKK